MRIRALSWQAVIAQMTLPKNASRIELGDLIKLSFSVEKSKDRTALAVFTVCLLTAFVLNMLGRVVFCKCGEWSNLWISDVWSSHTSQHLADPYSFSHFQHGMIFYWVLRFIGKPYLALALVIEGGWEILENTPFIINRYREGTVSLNYLGDSIVNSIGDIFAALLGFVATRRLSTTVAIFLYVTIELAMLMTIRDCLTLNVLMLVWPVAAIKNWQSGI